MVGEVGSLGKHLALVGFMGAGKTTIGREVARLTQRPFLDTDEEIERRFGPIPQIFAERGEAEFRRLEAEVVAQALASPHPSVIALGGGAVEESAMRARLEEHVALRVPVDVDEAWGRVRGSDRPLARDESEFRRLHDRRQELYRQVGREARDVEGALLEALCVRTGRGIGARVAEHAGPRSALIADELVLGLHRPAGRFEVHPVPRGEAAKNVQVPLRLWRELLLPRDGTVVALGGGSTTDVAGFVAATYLRGVRWIAVPTSLVGQVDAAIGGKTGIDLPWGKNLVGAFHFPVLVLIDPDLLSTLPEEERRQGMAEVVKTGLLAGQPLWELPEEEMVRACAAFKCAVVLSDPYERGRRAILNLGHTFGHALEAETGFSDRLLHGEAVALGMALAFRFSARRGLCTPADAERVEAHLAALELPTRLDIGTPAALVAHMRSDKKATGGRVPFILARGIGEAFVDHSVAPEEVEGFLASELG